MEDQYVIVVQHSHDWSSILKDQTYIFNLNIYFERTTQFLHFKHIHKSYCLP